MRFYLSGVDSISTWNKIKRTRDFYDDFLFSYYYLRTWFHKGDFSGKNIFLDSGAFSAKNKGLEISLGDYRDFIVTHFDKIECFSNLDVIGDTEQTSKNQKILEAEGLNPIPVYHWGEDVSILKRLCEDYDYVSIGKTVPIKSKKKLASQIVNCLEYVEYNDTKIHVFGLSSFPALTQLRFHIYSVDSIVWLIRASFKERITLSGGSEKMKDMERWTLVYENAKTIDNFMRFINGENISCSLYEKKEKHSIFSKRFI
jgi:hypothetical protein